MVFVYVPHGRNAIEPTREEAALLTELEERGVAPDGLEAALVARGVDPERARALAGLVRPRTAGERARAIGAALLWVAIAMVVAAGERPFRHWLRENHPGTEWLAGLIIPLIVLVAFAWTVLTRLRAAREARESVTRADQIDNRPIG